MFLFHHDSWSTTRGAADTQDAPRRHHVCMELHHNQEGAKREWRTKLNHLRILRIVENESLVLSTVPDLFEAFKGQE